MRRAGATLHRSARASHCRGLSCCGAQAPDAQAQQLWLTGPAAPRHVGSSQTRARTRVPCIGRQVLNHCATREAPKIGIFNLLIYLFIGLRWVFIAVCRLPLVAASTGFSLQWLLLLWSMGSRCVGFSSCGSRALERRLSSCGAQA